MSSIVVQFGPATILLLQLLSFLSFATSLRSLDGGPNLLAYICPPYQNNTASGDYMYNVGQLFNRKHYDEGNKSFYYGEYPDNVYGIYLCRFDITGETCQNCLAKATDMLVRGCHGNKTATTWFDECMVCYSNISSFFTLETIPYVVGWNEENITQPDKFTEILNQTFNDAIAMAIVSDTEVFILLFLQVYLVLGLHLDQFQGWSRLTQFKFVNNLSHQPGYSHRKMAIVVVLSAPTTIRSFWLISFLSFFMSQISLAYNVNRIGYSCDSTFGNNTASAVYGLNRGRLFTQKLYADGANSIYSNTSDGEDPDRVYGLYLCRGDVTKQTCRYCIIEAIGYAISEQACANTKSAIIWYDECMVQYSDKPFSFTFESVPALQMSNADNLNVSDTVAFRKALNRSFSQLIAVAISSELKYATDIVSISSSVTLYTIGQCIPDLSKEDCRNCLNSAAQLVEYDKTGSRYLYPSCSARFGLYQIWNSPVEAPPLVSDNTGGADLGRNRKENRAWIPITISVSAGVILVMLFGFLLLHKNRRNKRAKANNQEVRLICLREGRIGNDYSYDALQGENQMESQDLPMFPLDLTLEATQHFSDENKLGEGGFGPVYKGNCSEEAFENIRARAERVQE